MNNAQQSDAEIIEAINNLNSEIQKRKVETQL